MRTKEWETPSKFTVTWVRQWKFGDIKWRRFIMAVTLEAKEKVAEMEKKGFFSP